MWLALALMATTIQVPLSIGTLDWDATPPMRPRDIPSDGNAAYRAIVRSKECDLKGATETDFKRISVRFAALLEPDRTVRRLLIEDVGCQPLELLVGSMALQMVGKVDAPGGTGARWYRAGVRFDGVR